MYALYIKKKNNKTQNINFFMCAQTKLKYLSEREKINEKV